jgi:hypothetical protein
MRAAFGLSNKGRVMTIFSFLLAAAAAAAAAALVVALAKLDEFEGVPAADPNPDPNGGVVFSDVFGSMLEIVPVIFLALRLK